MRFGLQAWGITSIFWFSQGEAKDLVKVDSLGKQACFLLLVAERFNHSHTCRAVDQEKRHDRSISSRKLVANYSWLEKWKFWATIPFDIEATQAQFSYLWYKPGRELLRFVIRQDFIFDRVHQFGCTLAQPDTLFWQVLVHMHWLPNIGDSLFLSTWLRFNFLGELLV